MLKLCYCLRQNAKGVQFMCVLWKPHLWSKAKIYKRVNYCVGWKVTSSHATLKLNLREYLYTLFVLFQAFSVPSLTWWMMHSLVGRPPCPRRLTRCWTPGASLSLKDHHHLLRTCRSLNQDQPLPPPSLPRNRSKIYFCFVVIIFWFIFVRRSFLASLSD